MVITFDYNAVIIYNITAIILDVWKDLLYVYLKGNSYSHKCLQFQGNFYLYEHLRF